MNKQEQKANATSPLPVFIEETSKVSSPLPNSSNPTPESSGIQLIRNVKGTQQHHTKNDDQQEESYGNREEEPVKNSMFWLYRRFPHIV